MTRALTTARQETEANAFAMELLMPFDWIVRDCQGIDLCDERAVEKLARKYGVASTVMAVRIGEIRRELEMTRALPAAHLVTKAEGRSAPKNNHPGTTETDHEDA